ncbi:MAG: PEP/pyruvate-binding domain-containing protein [Caldilineaceae bacterium]
MSSPFLISLDAVRQTDVALIGGKAATLGELLWAGFPVPDGLCVTTAAFHLALADWQPRIQALLQGADLRNPVTAQRTALAIADLLVNLTLPAVLAEQLATTLPQLATPSTSFAVRSSATNEDGATLSYAGQYATSLGIRGLEAVKTAILSGWRSFFSANALAARAGQAVGRETESMALLIQPMLAAECAGVAFSVDPVQERDDLLVINAAWGLGAGVVDGTIGSDTFWVKRADLSIVQQQIVEKKQSIACDDQGHLIIVDVPAEQQRAATLPPAWLERIAQFTLAVESILATQHLTPQDIEWTVAEGRLWLLQARPLTGLPPALATRPPFPVAWQDEEERRSLWQHERQGDPNTVTLSDVQRPLQLDNLRDMETTRLEACRLLGAERNRAIKFCNGRMYVRPIPMPWSATDQRIRQTAMLDLRERLQQQGLTTWDHWGPEIIKATERLRSFDRNNADGPALADHLEEVLAVRRRHLPLHPAMNFNPPQRYYDAFAALSGLSGEEAKAVANRLLDSEETPLTHLIDELYALATLACQEDAVADLVAQAPADAMTQLAVLPQAAAFYARLKAFLDHYGERTGDGWGSEVTLAMPTWREQPSIVLTLIAPYLAANVSAPALHRQHARQAREAEITTFCAACPDPAVVVEFRRQLTYARKVCAVVEQHNHYLDQMYTGQVRQALVAAGHWLIKEGVLTTLDEIFWLHFAEIGQLLRSPTALDVPTLLASRQAEHQRWQTLETPPILGMPAATLPQRPPWCDEVTDNSANPESELLGRLQGLGVSHGRHSGRARVVNDALVLPALQAGDILVAQNVGPMWTPIFPILGGLVLEHGAVGQHAAATAREYGIPAVTHIRDACRRIVDGSWITVDGASGVVEVEELHPPGITPQTQA